MKRRHRILRTNRQRIAWTNTSEIPDAELVAAIKWLAHDVNLDRVVIHAKHAGPLRSSYGIAYAGIPGVTNLDGLKPWEWDYLITTTDGRGTSWRNTLAHEAKHIEQYREGVRRGEVAARAYASWAAERMT